jgi:hypothetical protein
MATRERAIVKWHLMLSTVERPAFSIETTI